MSDAPTRSASPAGDPTADLPGAAGGATHDLHESTAGPSTAAADPARPTTPPGYELLEQVGAGGMGVVYRAREIALDRDVAVKLLQDRYPAGSPGARRFLDEARITSQLQHPAIPPVHHVGTLPDGRPFLAMKLIKGDTLADLLEREPGDRGRFVAVFVRVCQALAYAHSRRVIHRDLKPANVMVGAFGEVQLMDWGLAKKLSGGAPAQPELAEVEDARSEIRTLRDAELVTQAGSILGTLLFMAPEQAEGALEEIDERSDVFGLGAVLCAILTGEPPYSGPSVGAVRLKAIRGETADAFARLDTCGADPELVALCKRCLARKREDRPRDADEVAKAVSAHLAAVEDRAKRAELDRVRSEEHRKRRRVQRALAGAGLLVLALAGVGAGLIKLWRDTEGAKKDVEVARDQLEGERNRTAKARDEAVRLGHIADGARAVAETQKGIAEKARAGEEDARKAVEREREKLAVFEYGWTMQVAHQEWRDNNLAATLALLNGTRRDLRGWEWHYLHRLCHSDLLTFKGHRQPVMSASWSPDGSRIVTASGDGTKVWDAKTGVELLALKGHAQPASSASWSADSSRIVTASNDTTAKVWDAKTGAELLALKGHTSPVGVPSWSADGSRIVTASGDGTKVWDAKTGAELLTLKGHTGAVYAASWSADGSRIVTGGADGTAKVWEARSGAELLTLKGHTSGVFVASWSADGSRIVTSSLDGTAKVWEVPEARLEGVVKTGTEVFTLKGHTRQVRSASFNPDGSRIVTSSVDGTAKVWDARTGAELLTLKGHTRSVNSASWSADGSRIVTASEDYTAKVWDARPFHDTRPPDPERPMPPAPREK